MPSKIVFLKFTVMGKKLPQGQFQITEGPSKFDLMCSLFDGKVVKITCDLTGPRASFKVVPKFEVIFTKVGIEDGSHDSWLGEVQFLSSPNYDNERRRFYYDTRRRTGHIKEVAK